MALAHPPPSASWRDQLASLAAGLDLSLVRLLGGAALLAVASVVGWRLLAPPPAPAEMQLPMADRAALTGDAHAVDAPPPPTPTSAPGSDEVVVHVVGAVPRPGVQHLKAGSRVVDAVHAAGGASPDADLGRLNLAAVLTDGEQVYVLRTGEAPPAPLPAPTGTAAAGTGVGPEAAGPPVDLNQATADQLDALPGIGPATAAAIIATRQEKGGFRSVDDLLDVRGIGDAKLAELRDRVKV
ncbi:MAG TPA: ComEA family DNA-binding protein [Acidimicrobiales bacterium]|nr:ComEA family DNA-binding protein [Acidimicrobiales bacterium]